MRTLEQGMAKRTRPDPDLSTGNATARSCQAGSLLHLVKKPTADDPRPMEQQPTPDDTHLRMVERLVRSHTSKVKRYLRKTLSSLEEIKDASQDIWLRLLQAPPKEPVDDEGKLLGAFARNVMRERVRAHATNTRRTPLPPPAADEDSESEDAINALASSQPSLEEAEDDRRAKQLIRRAMDRLTVLHRAVYIRRDVDGLSVPDTAKACGVSETKAERLLTEARAQILDFVTNRKRDFL